MKKIFIILFLVTNNIFSQENSSPTSKGEVMYNPPYYINYGLMYRKDNLMLYAPYIGIGIQPTKFSISFFARTGLQIYYKKLSWQLEYYHAFIPELSIFDYNKLQFFLQNTLVYDFNNFRISSLTRIGEIVHVLSSPNEISLEQDSQLYFTIKQILSLDAQIYNNEFTIITSMLNIGFDILPFQKQSSFYLKSVMPITIDFLHSKLGIMGTLFYTSYLSVNRKFIIGESFSGYDEAIDIHINKSNAYYNEFYDFYISLDFLYRLYLNPLPSPYNKFYFAVGGNFGFAFDDATINYITMGTFAFGYDLYNTIPFEIRFTLDQDNNFFVNLSIVSPISHRFDNNLD